MKRIEFRQVKVVSRLIDYVVDQQIWVDKILCICNWILHDLAIRLLKNPKLYVMYES